MNSYGLRRRLRSGTAGWRVEPLSEPGFCQNVARVCRIHFDFLAELIDNYTKRFRFFSVIWPPYGLQYFPVGDRLAFLNHEKQQRSE